MADVARDLRLNTGTTRYHLFILSRNHKVISHPDNKFVRYFKNSGTYDAGERSIYSLVRRKPLVRILSLLAQKPGLSNLELARELQLSTAATHEQVTELMDRGVLVKTPKSDGEYAYSIKAEYREMIARVIERT